MNITEIISRVLYEQINNPLLAQLKDKNVGEGKPLSEDEFKKIEEVTGGKWYLIQWLTKRVVSDFIKKEDIYKWKEYFQIYEKNKNKFQHKDLNLYKTKEEVQSLIDNIIQVREGDVKFEDIAAKDNFVSQKDIEKMEQGGGIKYLGIWKPSAGLKDLSKDGYQVFDVSAPTQANWKLYRDILGRCKGRDKGAKIDICTIADFDYFKRYLKEDKGSSYFVLFNLADPLSPYQLHVESDQFMNKNDSDKYNFPLFPFYMWLTTVSSKYTMKYLIKHINMTVPYEGKGYEDEKGRQGIWADYDDGDLVEIITYVNGKETGPFKEFFSDGKLSAEGTKKNGVMVGPYVSYDDNGKILEKGVLDKSQTKKGFWLEEVSFRYADDVRKRMVDYDTKAPISGLTKNDKLVIVSDFSYEGFGGNVVYFHENGQPKAIGKLTNVNKDRTGKWVFYFKDGSIRAEGKFSRDYPNGPWTIVFKRKNKKYIYTVNLKDGKALEKGKLYDSKGEFIKKIDYDKEFIPDIKNLTKL